MKSSFGYIYLKILESKNTVINLCLKMDSFLLQQRLKYNAIVPRSYSIKYEEVGNTFKLYICKKGISSVQFSHSVLSDSLQPHESHYTRPPCPSPTPGVHSDPCPSSRWCHPAISSSVIPFPSCPQSLPASESFPMSQLFAWGGQSTRVSALASFLPK